MTNIVSVVNDGIATECLMDTARRRKLFLALVFVRAPRNDVE
jgi:hypothetical protein